MRFGRTGFGFVEVDGVRYDHDVVLVEGRIEPRRKEFSSHLRAKYGHTPLTGEEFEEYFSGAWPEVVVIGTGQYGSLPLVGIEETAKRLGIRLVVEKTPRALEILNDYLERGARVGAVIHVTC